LIAAETDPSNPSIAIVEELLRARGDRLLADALMAATTGDEESAAQFLFDAERYPHTDPDSIDVVRDEITETVLERQFLSWLSQAEAHMAASRLTLPADDNAYDTLTALLPQYGSDPRLQASVQRLGERLLSRAAFSTTAGDFTEAGRLLDVASSLGVLAPEIATARASLQVATEDAVNTDEPFNANSAIDDAASETLADETLTGLAAGAVATLPVMDNVPATETSVSIDTAIEPPIDLGLVPESDAGVAALPPASGTKVADEPEKIGFSTLQDLGIVDYVPPRFPPRAERLGESGFVDVRFQINTDGSTGAIDVLQSEPGTLFDSSARRAVEQWRFPTRDESLTTQLRLTFELASP